MQDLPGAILMNHDQKSFYCWRHDRWFDALKLVQCFYRECLWMYRGKRKSKGKRRSNRARYGMRPGIERSK